MLVFLLNWSQTLIDSVDATFGSTVEVGYCFLGSLIMLKCIAGADCDEHDSGSNLFR